MCSPDASIVRFQAQIKLILRKIFGPYGAYGPPCCTYTEQELYSNPCSWWIKQERGSFSLCYPWHQWHVADSVAFCSQLLVIILLGPLLRIISYVWVNENCWFQVEQPFVALNEHILCEWREWTKRSDREDWTGVDIELVEKINGGI